MNQKSQTTHSSTMNSPNSDFIFAPVVLSHVVKILALLRNCHLRVQLFYLFIFYGCVGSSFLCEGFLQLRQAGATLHCGARAYHYRGLSCCGAQAPDAQPQQLWHTGLVAPRHVGSSQTRARTCVPCIGRQILNHCATRETPESLAFKMQIIHLCEPLLLIRCTYKGFIHLIQVLFFVMAFSFFLFL